MSSKLRKASRLTADEWLLFLQAVWLLWVAALLLQWRTLSEMFAWTDRGTAGSVVPESPRLKSQTISELVAVAARLALPQGSCLPQSLVTCRLLKRSGYQASLVIGTKVAERVRGLPFSAHAWVQLSDSSEPSPLEFYRGEHEPLVRFTRTG